MRHDGQEKTDAPDMRGAEAGDAWRGSLGDTAAPDVTPSLSDSADTSSAAKAKSPSTPLGSALRGRGWKVHLALVVAPIVALVLAVSFVAGCVGEAFSYATSSDDSIVSRDTKEQIVRADVDTEGLREIAAAVESMEYMPSNGINELWAQFLIYWDQGNRSLSWQSWPVPNGGHHPDRYCFNSTAAHIYILTTNDWSMTDDRAIEECRQTWEPKWEGYDCGWDRPVTWPWHQFDMWHERVNLQWANYTYVEEPHNYNHQYEKWHFSELKTKPHAEVYQKVKEELMAGHPVCGGCNPGEAIYKSDGSTWTPMNGHSFLWYKYDPVKHVFYAKDSSIYGSPSVEYPEHGGKIDPYELIGGCSAYWMEDEDRAKVDQKPPSAEALRVLKQAQLQMPDPPYYDMYYPLYTKEIWGSLYSRGADPEPEDLVFKLDGEDVSGGNLDWEGAIGSVRPQGGDGSEWLSGVLSAEGLDPPDGSAAEMYWGHVGGGCSTTASDPTLSTLVAGMAVGVPYVASYDDAQRVLGHVGIYIGDGVVAHDDGGVRHDDIDTFINEYEGVAPVAWWPSVAVGMEATGASVADEAVALPAPSSVSGADMDYIGRQVARLLSLDGVPLGDVLDARIVGQVPEGDVTVVGYVLSLADGSEAGFDVFVRDEGASVVPSDWVVVDGQSLYGTSGHDYAPIGTVSQYGSAVRQAVAWMLPETAPDA